MVFKKLLSLLLILAINLNAGLITVSYAYAQEATESAPVEEPAPSIPEAEIPTPEPLPTPNSSAPTTTPELTPTPSPTVEETQPETTPTPEATPTPIPETTDLTETLPEQLIQAVDTITSTKQETTDTGIIAEQVSLNTTYKYPQNEKVTVTFTKLPENPGSLSIKQITLSKEGQEAVGAFSDTAYDITSDMTDGEFEYTLTLPTLTTNYVEVKASEDGQNFVTVGGVAAQTDTLTIIGLDHFTIFVVVGTISGSTATGFTEASDAVVINEFVFNPSTGNDWIELYNKGLVSRDLNNWVLDDDDPGTSTVMATLNQTIPAGGFLAVDVSNRLNSSDDALILKDNSGMSVSEVAYKDGTLINGAQDVGTISAGESVARSTNGGSIWVKASSPTKGYTNENSTVYVDDNFTQGSEFGTQGFPFGTIQKGIDSVSASSTVNVAAGNYSEPITQRPECGNEPASICLYKSLTLNGASGAVLDGTGLGFGSGIALGRPAAISNITIKGFEIKNYSNNASAFQGGVGSGIIAWNAQTSNITIQDNNIHDVGWDGVLVGSDDGSVQSNWTVTNNTFTNVPEIAVELTNTANSQVTNNTITGPSSITSWDTPDAGVGIEIAVRAHNAQSITAGTNNIVSGNTISGAFAINSRAGINLLSRAYDALSVAVLNGVTVRDNSITGTGTRGISVVAEQRNGSSSTVSNLSINKNTITQNNVGIHLGDINGTVEDGTYSSISVLNNTISGNTQFGIENAVAALITAENNWWGSTNPNFASIISGNVTHDPWYVNSGRTVLSTAVSGSTVSGTTADVQLTSVTSGQADLPSGVTTIALSNSTFMDVSSSTNTASGGNINIGGLNVPLNNFTSGTLGSVNLSVAQAVGGISVLVNKAVKLASGTGGQPIILSNSSLSGINVSIPDSTSILAPSGWNGMIQPPKTGSSIGTAPSGFLIGNTIIEVGSSDAVLLFDKPVVVTLSGVMGDVGYKAAGSTTWHKINTICNSYDNPTNVTFPGECRVSNGTDTRIYTYHFTTFGSLDAVSVSGESFVEKATNLSAAGAPVCTDTAPGTPPVLVSARATGNNQVTLNWLPSAGPLTYYLVAYGTTSGSLQFGNPNVGVTTSYTVSDLSGGRTYYFKVRAGNNCAPGAYSNEVAVTVGGAQIGGPATGFEEGVLGTKSDLQKPEDSGKTQKEESPAITGTVEGSSSPQGFWASIGSFFSSIFTVFRNLFRR